MNKFIVTIKPNSSTEEQVEDLAKRIKEYPGWARLNDYTWCICSNDKAATVRDSLSHWLSKDAFVYVFYFDSGHAATGDVKILAWIRNNFLQYGYTLDFSLDNPLDISNFWCFMFG